MHNFKKIVLRFTFALVVVHLLLVLTGNTYFWKALTYNFPGIYDFELFHNAPVHYSHNPQPWKISKQLNKTPLSKNLEEQLIALKTTAYLVIKGDEIQQEYYWNDTDSSTISNSFSAAKSYVSALIGFAIQDKYIKNVNQPIGDFLPDFKKEGKEHITIKHLLQMSSGLNWKESYSGPFSITTQAYYDDDLEKVIAKLDVDYAPGKDFVYRSGDTQILGLVLRKATGFTLSEYAYLKLWNPLGAEHDALWSLDSELGNEKAYCCLNATARDFARLPKLYLNKGVWNGKQILDSNYIKESLTPTGKHDPQSGNDCNFYGYQWWLIPNYKGHDIFYARGILGQFMIAIPDLDIVIVRLGHERGDKKDGIHHILTYAMIDEVLQQYE